MENEKRLIQYSTFAACFIIIQQSRASSIYTDINPDVVLANDNEYLNIDVDNNGVLDFQFKVSTGWFYTEYGDHYSYSYYMHAGHLESGNRIAGVKSVISPSYGGFTQYFPYALEAGMMINEELSFQNNNFEILAYKIRNEDGGGGPSGGFWFDGLNDHYIGVKFYDELACLHYGWIRCDVKASVDSLIIKDYAFETKCSVGIIAGDTIGDTTTVGINEFSTLNATVYSFKNTIYINLNELVNNAEMNIYDLNGKNIYSTSITHQFTQFAMSNKKGIYIVELTSEGKKFAKKIFIN